MDGLMSTVPTMGSAFPIVTTALSLSASPLGSVAVTVHRTSCPGVTSPGAMVRVSETPRLGEDEVDQL